MTIIQNPRQFKVPDWMLNRKKDVKDGKYSQVVSNTLDMKLREDLERLKKIRAHRGLRHYCALPPARVAPCCLCVAARTLQCFVLGTPLFRAEGSAWRLGAMPLQRPTPLTRFPSSRGRGPARAWPADEDHRPQGPHRRCVQEEGLDFISLARRCGSAPWSSFRLLLCFG